MEERDEKPVLGPDELARFRGAPFEQSNIDAALGAIRTVCDWHIAPVLESTEYVDSNGRGFFLRTLRLASVIEVLDGDDPDKGPVIDSKDLRVRPEGFVQALRGRRLPEYLKVRYTHGYETWPDGLMHLTAALTREASQGATRSESLAARSITLADGMEMKLAAPLLEKFSLGYGASR